LGILVIGTLTGLLLWRALGRPELPSPGRLTVGEVSSLVKTCLGIAASLAATVALVVAYRKQRDAEDRRESDTLNAALDALGSENLFTRVAGLYALRDLADRYEVYRQRCIDLMCMALIHTQDADREDVRFRDAISEVLQSRLLENDQSWGSYDFVLSGGRASGINLSNLRLVGGRLTLRNLSVGVGGLNLSGLQLHHGARLDISDVSVSGTLALDRFVARAGTRIDCTEMSVMSGGTLSMKENAQVAAGAELTMSRTRVGTGAELCARDLVVSGSVISRHLVVDSGGRVDWSQLRCAGGSVTFGTVDLDENAALILVGSTISHGGAIRIDECLAGGGAVHANNIRLTDGSALLLRSGYFSGGAFLNLSGLRNGGRSLAGVDANIEQRGVIAIEGAENEGEGSVFFLRAIFHGGRPEVRLRAGGNYGAHSHISLETLHNRPDAGVLKLDPPSVIGGEVEFNVDDGIDIALCERHLQWRPEGVVKVTLRPEHHEVLSCRDADTDALTCDFWANHARELPNGTKLNGYDGTREFSTEEVRLARSGSNPRT
jgi:hypothetical protein